MNQRQAKRTPVTLKIKFKSDTLDQFIERYSVDISHGGIFIRTKDPLPVGTSLRFEFQLKDATPLIGGEGTVVWTRDPQSAGGGSAPGMGVRFDRLPSQSQETLEAILAHKPAAQPAPAATEGFSEVPTRVAPSPLAAELGHAEGEGPTPLPMPFSSADEVDEEAFEASTKVASFDDLMASARQSSARPTGPSAAPIDSGWDNSPSPWSDDIQSSTGDMPVATTSRASGRVQIPADPADPVDVDDQPARRSSQDMDVRGSQPDLRGSDAALEKARATSKLALIASDPDDEADDTAIENAATTPLSAVPEPPAPTPAEPVAASAPEERKSRGPVLAVAVALIVAAGLGGYYMMTRNQGAAATSDTGAVAKTPDPSPDPGPAITADAPAVAAGTATVTVESEPAGAMAALLGPDGKIVASKPTPASFDALVDGTTYKVRLTADGYVPTEIDVVAGGDEPAVAKLKAMPKFLRVTSAPGGASVYVNGRRYGQTPTDVRIEGRLARADSFQISVRKRGHRRASERVAANVEFREQDDMLIHEVELSLQRVRRRPPPRDSDNDSDSDSGDAEPAGDDQTNTGTGDTGDTSDTGDTTDPGDTAEATDTGDTADTGITGNTATDPAGDEGEEIPEEPAPDWMQSG